MAWPNTTISTSNVDSGSDTPANARAQIYQTITAVNDIINTGPAGEFVVIKFTGNVARPFSYIPGNFTWYPEMTTAYVSGNSFVQFRANVQNNTATSSGYAMVLSAGRYEVSFIATSIKQYANGSAYTGTASTVLNPIPSVIEGNTSYGVGSVTSGSGPTHAEVIFGGAGGGSTNFFDVPSHLVMDAQRVATFANSGGFVGSSLGTIEGQGPTGRPDIQYIKFQRISN
jgi:hypothetical protein